MQKTERQGAMPIEGDSRDKQVLSRCVLALIVGSGLVAICYFFVDRPVAFFVHDQRLARFELLRWLTLPEPLMQLWAPLALTVLAIRRAWGPLRRAELVLLAAALGVVIADQFKESLKDPFSRLWPDTWINDNPSLIHDGAYGFYPFHGGPGYASFPSGHTARALAAVAVLWIAYPRWRWIWAAIAIVLGGSLVGMNYHFVGDVIAGGVIGGLVGTCMAALCGVRRT